MYQLVLFPVRTSVIVANKSALITIRNLPHFRKLAKHTRMPDKLQTPPESLFSQCIRSKRIAAVKHLAGNE